MAACLALLYLPSIIHTQLQRHAVVDPIAEKHMRTRISSAIVSSTTATMFLVLLLLFLVLLLQLRLLLLLLLPLTAASTATITAAVATTSAASVRKYLDTPNLRWIAVQALI